MSNHLKEGVRAKVAAIIVRNVVFVLVLVISFVLWARRAARLSSLDSDQDSEYVTTQEYIMFGASLMSDGWHHFPDWCASMLREFDESIEPELENYFTASKFVSKHPSDQWSLIAERRLWESVDTRGSKQ